MAKVTNLTDYGCFAELEEGVEGLVHVSEMDWTNRNIHPSKVVQVGDEVEVALDAVEDGSGETRLSRERAKRARTWERLDDAFQNGKIVHGVINGRVKGGFTVDISDNAPEVRPAIITSLYRTSCLHMITSTLLRLE